MSACRPLDRQPAALPSTWAAYCRSLARGSDAVCSQGVGMADGSLPLGDMRVALCVPRSCRPAALQSALQLSLKSHPSMAVQVRPEQCHDQDAGQTSTATTLFW